MEIINPALAGQKLKIAKIAEKFHLKLVLIFGSFANGKNRKDSDLDMAVLGSKKISFNEQVDLINEFSSVFHKNIDLSILNRTNPLLLFEASKNSLLLYGSREEFMQFKLRAFNAYNDYAPFFEMEKNLNKKIISAYAY
ncbi:MAG: nucleotidyltransferase domain-containing protein [Candidatus Moranbacteria bacterium]|nr:nucleotidyltransferase domain-containing protein [Candidatus Moranbacteria bacterium]